MIHVVHASGGPLRDIVVPVDTLMEYALVIIFLRVFVLPRHPLTSNRRSPRKRSGEFCPSSAHNNGDVGRGRGTTVHPYASSAVGDEDDCSGSFEKG